MNAELPTSNWQHVSEPIARLLKEKARQQVQLQTGLTETANEKDSRDGSSHR